jgi:hypothetical protein
MVKAKLIYFGRSPVIQVECPKCKIWQFNDGQCENCELVFPVNPKITDRPEYRSQAPLHPRERIHNKTRFKVFERDEYICQYCARRCYDSWLTDPRQLTIDHLVPVNGGGRNDIDNLITSCIECNVIKSDKHFKSIEDARQYIRERLTNY